MREHLHRNGDEYDDVAPEDRLLRVVVNVDGGAAVNRQTRNARRCFALFKCSDSRRRMLEHHRNLIRMLLDDDGRRRSDRNLIVKLERVRIVAGCDSRVLQQAEQKVMTVHGRVGAVIVRDLIVLSLRAGIGDIDTFV